MLRNTGAPTACPLSGTRTECTNTISYQLILSLDVLLVFNFDSTILASASAIAIVLIASADFSTTSFRFSLLRSSSSILFRPPLRMMDSSLRTRELSSSTPKS